MSQQKLPFIRLLLGYIYEKRRAAAFFLISMMFFFAVCLLYQLESMASLLYAFFLWAFSALCFTAYDFSKYVKKYRTLETAAGNAENMLELLPTPAGLIEQEYRQIIGTMTEELRQLRDKVSLRDTDMADYYTMWAHQIKIPIAAMGLLLQSSADKPQQSENADNKLLLEELFKIENYVEMVLYYQRLDSITSDFLFKKYDLYDIVKQALKKHSMLFINSRLSLDLQQFSHMVVTDEKWFQFVIGQIFSNALKYTTHGGISIRLETCLKEALLIIEDTGIGIRPEDLPRIFERGYTGYNGRLDKKSTGIGLYLCKKILDKLSLTIEVSSEVGKGTKVTIHIPEGPEA